MTGTTNSARRGPVVVLSHDRARVARLRELLDGERFDLFVAPAYAQLPALLSERCPTVLVLDWAADDEPGCAEVIQRVRGRADRPRIVVVADGAEAEVLRSSLAVRAVVGAALDAEEVADAIWRVHHETIEARQAGRNQPVAIAASDSESDESGDGPTDR